MANFVKIRVPNIGTISKVYNQIAILRATDYNGTYNEITTSGTRPSLDPAEISYLYVDQTGLSTSFYRYQFVNNTVVPEATSNVSEQFQGESDIAIPILTPEELRRQFLFGIPLDDGMGNTLDDDTLEFYIEAATTYAEKMIDIIIRPTVYAAEYPAPADQHDYYKQDYNKYMWMKLLHVPVISVQEVRFQLPSTGLLQTFDPSWIVLDEVAGVVQIVPGSPNSSAIALGVSTMWLPLTQGLLNFIPEVFEVDYTAGFADGKVPADIKQLIGYLAAIDILSVIGDILFGPGVAGSDVGLDLLMTRLRTTRSDKSSIFGARIRQYAERAKMLIDEQRLIYRGVPLMAG